MWSIAALWLVGCGTPTAEWGDACPADPDKTAPGTCGCGLPDTDADADGTPDCIDACPDDSDKTVPGSCGCGIADADTDADGTPDCVDGCPTEVSKTVPGWCGCTVADTDADSDGTPDCLDRCPSDPLRTDDVDSDGDGLIDCLDGCPGNAEKTAPDSCGCGTLVDEWRTWGRNLQGMAVANGVLYAIDVITLTDVEVVSFDASGQATPIFDLDHVSVGLAATDTHLYLDDEFNNQRIHEYELGTWALNRSFSTGVTGGNRGLAAMDGSLWHLGVVDGNVGFSQIDIATGNVGTTVVAPYDAVFANGAAAADGALYYVTGDGPQHPDCDPLGCDLFLRALSTDGTDLCTQFLGTTTRGEPQGFAAGGGRFYLQDRDEDVIWVYE